MSCLCTIHLVRDTPETRMIMGRNFYGAIFDGCLVETSCPTFLWGSQNYCSTTWDARMCLLGRGHDLCPAPFPSFKSQIDFNNSRDPGAILQIALPHRLLPVRVKLGSSCVKIFWVDQTFQHAITSINFNGDTILGKFQKEKKDS